MLDAHMLRVPRTLRADSHVLYDIGDCLLFTIVQKKGIETIQMPDNTLSSNVLRGKH